MKIKTGKLEIIKQRVQDYFKEKPLICRSLNSTTTNYTYREKVVADIADYLKSVHGMHFEMLKATGCSQSTVHNHMEQYVLKCGDIIIDPFYANMGNNGEYPQALCYNFEELQAFWELVQPMEYPAPKNRQEESSREYEYHPEAQKRVMVTPDWYFQTIGKPNWGPGSEGFDSARLDAAIQKIQAGHPLDVPFIDLYEDGTYADSQDGRHRTLAAKMEGMDQIPCIIYFQYKDGNFMNVNDKNEDNYDEAVIPKGITTELPHPIHRYDYLAISTDKNPVMWYKYNADRGKNFTNSNGSVKVTKNDILGIQKMSKNNSRVIVLKKSKQKYILSTESTVKLLSVCKKYKGKVDYTPPERKKQSPIEVGKVTTKNPYILPSTEDMNKPEFEDLDKKHIDLDDGDADEDWETDIPKDYYLDHDFHNVESRTVKIERS